MHMRTPDNLS